MTPHCTVMNGTSRHRLHTRRAHTARTVPPYELKRRKGATPWARKGPRHTSVMALPTPPMLARHWLLSCLYLHLDAGYSYSSQDISMHGVVLKTGFKRIWQAMLQSSKNLRSRLFHSRFCTFDSSISDLGRARRSPALSVLGGEADYVISAHHRGAARRF